MNELSRAREKASELGLYDPAYEHDACGLGFVASVKGLPSHEIVQQGLQILKNLDHRGAVGADPLCVAGLLQFKDGTLLLAADDPAVGGSAEPRGGVDFGHMRSLLFIICPFFSFRLISPVGWIRMAEVI